MNQAHSTGSGHVPSGLGHVHFIGIGGAGTSGLAELLLMQGKHVTGSDLAFSRKTEELTRLGATIFEGHKPEHIPEHTDLIVYSSAVRPDNPEFLEAKRRGIRLVRRADFMAELLEDHKVVAVAGTHGKTTTTSMIAAILIEARLDPIVLVGASVRELGNRNSRAGYGKLAVVEADEYDRSFLTLSPFIAVMTSLEAEHLDIYKDLDDLKETFVQFANQGPSTWQTGYAIVCIDEKAVREITPKLEKRIVSYGISSPESKYRAVEIVHSGQRSRSVILRGGIRLGELELSVPGEHNIKNALAALAVGEVLSIPFETSKRALKRFAGAERRFDVIGEANGITVIDDYAHHPTEIRATLETARKSYPGRRIVACFQPHTFTRTRDFAEDFGHAFGELADALYLLDIYPAREAPIEGITSGLIFAASQHPTERNTLKIAKQIGNLEALPGVLSESAQPGDVILTIGAGTITSAAPRILEALEKREAIDATV